EACVVTRAERAPLLVITAFVVTVVPWKSVRTSAGSSPSSCTPSRTPMSNRGGVEGTFATRDSPESLTAKTSVNVPPVSQPTIQFIPAGRRLPAPRAEPNWNGSGAGRGRQGRPRLRDGPIRTPPRVAHPERKFAQRFRSSRRTGRGTGSGSLTSHLSAGWGSGKRDATACASENR